MLETKEIVVAVVAGGASIGVAILSWIRAARAAHVGARNAVEIERLRSEGAQRLELIRLHQPRWEQTSKALSEAWGAIQIIRDHIARFVGPGAYDADVFRDRVAAEAETLSQAYARNGSHLNEAARQAWHRAKNIAEDVRVRAAALAQGLPEQQHATHVGVLSETRAQLADCQAVLSNADRQLMFGVVRQFIGDSLTERLPGEG